jgi:hypothetical protein
LVFSGSFNTSLAFNFANPKITDEFARIAEIVAEVGRTRLPDIPAIPNTSPSVLFG